MAQEWNQGESEDAVRFPLNEQLDKLDAALDRLEGERNHLFNRLMVILSPAEPDSAKASPDLVPVRPPLSDVTLRVMDLARRVDLVGTDLADWRGRLEVG